MTVNLILRVDGGPTIGGGHVMRCLALAQAWAEAGGRAAFCAAALAPSLRRRVLDEGFECIALDAEPGSMTDADLTVAGARRVGATIVVADGYHLGTGFRSRLRGAGLKVAGLDDNGEIGTYIDDLVVNQNRHATAALYPRRAEHTRLLLGTEYVLLRHEFKRWQREPPTFPAQIRRLLVTLGAADPNNVTGAVMTSIASVLPADTETAVVVGASNPHFDPIAELGPRIPHCHVVGDPGRGLPRLMESVDLAVCAGGSTMWELAYMGVPFIPVVIAENQRQAVAAMARDGYPTADAAAVARDLPAAVATLLADAHRRQTLSRLGRRLVDGDGAERVCAALRALPA